MVDAAKRFDWLSPEGLTGATVALVGMARSGRSVAGALLDRGARILAFDRKDLTTDPEIVRLVDRGMAFSSGDETPGLETSDFVVTSPGLKPTAPSIQKAQAASVPVISEIEVAYRISRAPIVAFTGTNGKSTTTALCGHILKTAGISALVGGNLAPGTPFTTLAHTAREKDVLVAEISSFQLEWIDEFRPRVAAVLNLSPEHLDHHSSIEEYGQAKARIAENQGAADLAIYGDRFVEDYPELLRGNGRHYQFSRSHPVEAGAYIDKQRMRIVGRVDASEGSLPDVSVDISRFSLLGGHNLENAMAATLAALEMGARPEAVERALRTFQGLPHRMELVAEKQGVRFINNSMCTNPAACIASLEGVPGGLVVITGGKSKGLEMRPVGEALARRARWVVLIGETAPEMEQFIRDAGSTATERASSMDAAVAAAAARAQGGDTVLLLPGFSSFDMFQDFEDRGRSFVNAVRACTAEGGGGI